MYNSLQQNPFERQTDLLEQPEIREQILIIYLAAAAIAHSNWKQALSEIAKYRQMVRNSRLQRQQALELELRFMQAFCAYKMGNCAKSEQMIDNMLQSIIQNATERSHDRSLEKNKSQSQSMGDISHKQFSFKAFAVKVYTLAANLIITQTETSLDFKEIKRGLIQLLQPEEMRQFIPQVLGTLTGCKYFKPMIDLKHFQDKISGTVARKLQILADWKFIAGLAQQAIQFKQRALSIWQAVNSHKQILQCRKQLDQLKKSNSKSQYKLRLARIKVFAEPIIKLQPPFNQNSQKKLSNPLIKLYLPVLLDELTFNSQEKLKPKLSVLSQSKLRKEPLLERITSECQLFYQTYKEEIGGQATNLLLNSKFVDQQFRKVRKCLSIFNKLKALRLRQVFNRLNRTIDNFSKEDVISKFKASELT